MLKSNHELVISEKGNASTQRLPQRQPLQALSGSFFPTPPSRERVWAYLIWSATTLAPDGKKRQTRSTGKCKSSTAARIATVACSRLSSL